VEDFQLDEFFTFSFKSEEQIFTNIDMRISFKKYYKNELIIKMFILKDYWTKHFQKFLVILFYIKKMNAGNYNNFVMF